MGEREHALKFALVTLLYLVVQVWLLHLVIHVLRIHIQLPFVRATTNKVVPISLVGKRPGEAERKRERDSVEVVCI